MCVYIYTAIYWHICVFIFKFVFVSAHVREREVLELAASSADAAAPRPELRGGLYRAQSLWVGYCPHLVKVIFTMLI